MSRFGIDTIKPFRLLNLSLIPVSPTQIQAWDETTNRVFLEVPEKVFLSKMRSFFKCDDASQYLSDIYEERSYFKAILPFFVDGLTQSKALAETKEQFFFQVYFFMRVFSENFDSGKDALAAQLEIALKAGYSSIGDFDSLSVLEPRLIQFIKTPNAHDFSELICSVYDTVKHFEYVFFGLSLLDDRYQEAVLERFFYYPKERYSLNQADSILYSFFIKIDENGLEKDYLSRLSELAAFQYFEKKINALSSLGEVELIESILQQHEELPLSDFLLSYLKSFKIASSKHRLFLFSKKDYLKHIIETTFADGNMDMFLMTESMTLLSKMGIPILHIEGLLGINPKNFLDRQVDLVWYTCYLKVLILDSALSDPEKSARWERICYEVDKAMPLKRSDTKTLKLYYRRVLELAASLGKPLDFYSYADIARFSNRECLYFAIKSVIHSRSISNEEKYGQILYLIQSMTIIKPFQEMLKELISFSSHIQNFSLIEMFFWKIAGENQSQFHSILSHSADLERTKEYVSLCRLLLLQGKFRVGFSYDFLSAMHAFSKKIPLNVTKDSTGSPYDFLNFSYSWEFFQKQAVGIEKKLVSFCDYFDDTDYDTLAWELLVKLTSPLLITHFSQKNLYYVLCLVESKSRQSYDPLLVFLDDSSNKLTDFEEKARTLIQDMGDSEIRAFSSYILTMPVLSGTFYFLFTVLKQLESQRCDDLWVFAELYAGLLLVFRRSKHMPRQSFLDLLDYLKARQRIWSPKLVDMYIDVLHDRGEYRLMGEVIAIAADVPEIDILYPKLYHAFLSSLDSAVDKQSALDFLKTVVDQTANANLKPRNTKIPVFDYSHFNASSVSIFLCLIFFRDPSCVSKWIMISKTGTAMSYRCPEWQSFSVHDSLYPIIFSELMRSEYAELGEKRRLEIVSMMIVSWCQRPNFMDYPFFRDSISYVSELSNTHPELLASSYAILMPLYSNHIDYILNSGHEALADFFVTSLLETVFCHYEFLCLPDRSNLTQLLGEFERDLDYIAYTDRQYVSCIHCVALKKISFFFQFGALEKLLNVIKVTDPSIYPSMMRLLQDRLENKLWSWSKRITNHKNKAHDWVKAFLPSIFLNKQSLSKKANDSAIFSYYFMYCFKSHFQRNILIESPLNDDAVLFFKACLQHAIIGEQKQFFSLLSKLGITFKNTDSGNAFLYLAIAYWHLHYDFYYASILFYVFFLCHYPE